jgi:hypothetical protein
VQAIRRELKRMLMITKEYAECAGIVLAGIALVLTCFLLAALPYIVAGGALMLMAWWIFF